MNTARITELINKCMNAIQNKYTTWYWNLIDSRRLNPKTALTESHHIIPRSLGGTDSTDNLIHLTKREHFVAHLLLSKMFVGRDDIKMKFACRHMLTKYTPNSRLYEMIKTAANISMSELWKDPEWAARVIGDRKIRMAEPEVRKNLSDTMIEVWSRPEYREKHSAAMKKYCSSEGSKKIKSSAMKSVWQDPEKVASIMGNRKPHSEERKANQSKRTIEQNKASWSDPIVREKRITGIKAACAKRKAAKEAALLVEQNAQSKRN